MRCGLREMGFGLGEKQVDGGGGVNERVVRSRGGRCGSMAIHPCLSMVFSSQVPPLFVCPSVLGENHEEIWAG